MTATIMECANLVTLKTSLAKLAIQNPQLTDPQTESGRLWRLIQEDLVGVVEHTLQQNQIFLTTMAIAESADTVTTVSELVPALVDLIHQHFTETAVAIYLLDKIDKTLKRRATTTLSTDFLPETLAHTATSPIYQAVETRQIITPIDDNLGKGMILPLLSRNEVVGALVLADVSPLHPDNLIAWQTLATQVASTIQTTRLFTTIDQQLEQLGTLYHISLQVGSHPNIDLRLHQHGLDFDALLDNLAQLSLQLTRAEGSRVLLKDPDAGQTIIQRMATTQAGAIGQGQNGKTPIALSEYIIEKKQAQLGNHWANHTLAKAYPTSG